MTQALIASPQTHLYARIHRPCKVVKTFLNLSLDAQQPMK